MTVNAKDILDAAKARLDDLTKAYEQEDYLAFKSLAETSFIAGDEEIKFPAPVLDDDYCFEYKGHRFTIMNCVSASNDKLRSKDYKNILTDLAVIWEMVHIEDYYEFKFVNWCCWEFNSGMQVDSLALTYINRYIEKEEQDA